MQTCTLDVIYVRGDGGNETRPHLGADSEFLVDRLERPDAAWNPDDALRHLTDPECTVDAIVARDGGREWIATNFVAAVNKRRKELGLKELPAYVIPAELPINEKSFTGFLDAVASDKKG